MKDHTPYRYVREPPRDATPRGWGYIRVNLHVQRALTCEVSARAMV